MEVERPKQPGDASTINPPVFPAEWGVGRILLVFACAFVLEHPFITALAVLMVLGADLPEHR